MTHGPPLRAPRGESGRRTSSSLALPALTGLAGVSAVAYIGSVSPHEPGHYPGCVFLALTGLQCPGCGTLRAVHELAHGDLVAAADLNVVATVLFFVAVGAWFVWVRTRLGLRAGPNLFLTHATTGLALFLPIFGVLRNLEPFAFLAP